eukprot:2067783-Alexandrium_andersonii.AAC.1
MLGAQVRSGGGRRPPRAPGRGCRGSAGRGMQRATIDVGSLHKSGADASPTRGNAISALRATWRGASWAASCRVVRRVCRL